MSKLSRNENLTTALTRSINELTCAGEFSKMRRKVIRLCNRVLANARRNGAFPTNGWKSVMEDAHKPVRAYAKTYARPMIRGQK